MAKVNSKFLYYSIQKFFQTPCTEVYRLCDEVCVKMESFTAQYKRISYCAQLLGIAPPDDDTLRVCAAEVKRVKVSTFRPT